MDDLFEHQHGIESVSERDRAINTFYTHFIFFLGAILALALFGLVEGGSFWIQWVVLGWGSVIGLHAYDIFVRRPRIEHEAREKRRAAEEAAAATPKSATSDTSA